MSRPDLDHPNPQRNPETPRRTWGPGTKLFAGVIVVFVLAFIAAGLWVIYR